MKRRVVRATAVGIGGAIVSGEHLPAHLIGMVMKQPAGMRLGRGQTFEQRPAQQSAGQSRGRRCEADFRIRVRFGMVDQ